MKRADVEEWIQAARDNPGYTALMVATALVLVMLFSCAKEIGRQFPATLDSETGSVSTATARNTQSQDWRSMPFEKWWQQLKPEGN